MLLTFAQLNPLSLANLPAMQVLLIDNLDSFAHNLVHCLALAGGEVHIRRSDTIDPGEVLSAVPDLVVLSPGPGRPEAAGEMMEVIAQSIKVGIPVFGVCLGMQGICAHYGVPVVHAPAPIHGKASELAHSGRELFEGLPSPLVVGRYHSLCADAEALDKSRELDAVARTDDGVVMAVTHRFLPIWGVQFHPESILTPDGQKLVANAVRLTEEYWEEKTRS